MTVYCRGAAGAELGRMFGYTHKSSLIGQRLRIWGELLKSRSFKSWNRKMAKKKKAVRREWTATEIRKLKGLAKKKIGADKIARTLKRTVAATKMKASGLGVSLDTRG